MSQLPATSTEHYLTGMTALNIPGDDGKCADWHFTSIFLSNNNKYRIAGLNIPETHHILGDYGIRECSHILRKHGVQLKNEARVYSANFIRAILDLLYENLVHGNVPNHIQVSDLLDYEEMNREFWEKYEKFRQAIRDEFHLKLLKAWEDENRIY